MDNAEPRSAPGLVCTFYSFKGGVGRSMALANIAVLLAKWGQRVLVIDWDLEAPGIEKFFERWISGTRRTNPGLIDLILSSDSDSPLEWRDCLLSVQLPQARKIRLLHAGRDDGDYTQRLRSISWERLFAERQLGNVLEGWRRQWIGEFDFVLVDSRTGITDIGGICTILLPDVLLSLFTATDQSLSGVEDVIQRARRAHENLPIDRKKLLIVPVPARDESANEYELAEQWRKRFAAKLADFFTDWMPKDESPDRIMDLLKIPYFAYWSFGERLPVLEEDPDNPKKLAYSYQLLARLLFSKLDWQEVRNGTRTAEAEDATRVLVAQQALAAQQVRERAQVEAAQREKAEREAALMELAGRRERYFVERLSPRLRTLRTRKLIWLSTSAIGAIVSLVAVYRWFGEIAFFFREGVFTELAFIALTVLGSALCALVFGFLWHRRAHELERALDRETALYEQKISSYADAPESAYARFVQVVEDLIATSGRAGTSKAPPGSVREPAVAAASEPTSAPVAGSAPTPAPAPAPSQALPEPVAAELAPGEYSCDVLISFRESPVTAAWVKEFSLLLATWVTELLGRDIKIISAPAQTAADSIKSDDVTQALGTARCVVPILTPSYFQSALLLTELQRLQTRRPGAVLPVVLLRSDEYAKWLRDVKWADFSDFPFVGEGFTKTERYVDFQASVRRLAESVAEAIRNAPERALIDADA